MRSDPPLNNQLGALATLHVTPTTGDAVDRRPSLLVGGPPRGITLSRQNSISSQTPADKSAQRPGRSSPAAALQPANDARAAGDRSTVTTTPTAMGDQSDVAGENVARNLEASAVLLFLCLRHQTVSAEALCFWAVRPPAVLVRSFVSPDRSCYHDISRTA